MQFGAVWCSLSIYLDLLQTTWVIYTYNTCAYKEKRAGVWMNNYICLKHLQKRFLGAEHFHWYYKGNGDTKHESRKTGMMLVFFFNTLDWYKASQIGSSQGCLPKEWTLPWGSCVCSTEVIRINGQEFEFHTWGILRASISVTFRCFDKQHHQKLPGDKRLSYISRL